MILSYPNRWVENLEQNIGDRLDCAVPFAYLDETQDNILQWRVTGIEYTKILSALMTGLDIFYPDESHALMATFLEAAHCPPELSEAGDCIAYPLYATFLQWQPMNPFTHPNEVPSGYLDTPFIVYDGGGSLPPGYNAGDVYTPFSAINLDPFDLFTGALPQIKLTVIGAGQIELDLLAIGQGGVALISVDNPPDLGDILSSILRPDQTVIDLELDLTSIPPEDDIGVQHEIDIDKASGVPTDIYITFLPVVDDSFIPLRYGGGIRKNGIQLCGFEGFVDVMAIQQIRVNGTVLESTTDGMNWDIVSDLCDLACITALEGQANSLQSQISANVTRLDAAEGRLDAAEGRLDSVEPAAYNALGIANNNASRLDVAEGRLDSVEPAAYSAQGIANNNSSRLDAAEGRLDNVEPAAYSAQGIANNNDGRLNALEPQVSALASGLEDVTDAIEFPLSWLEQAGIWKWSYSFEDSSDNGFNIIFGSVGADGMNAVFDGTDYRVALTQTSSEPNTGTLFAVYDILTPASNPSPVSGGYATFGQIVTTNDQRWFMAPLSEIRKVSVRAENESSDVNTIRIDIIADDPFVLVAADLFGIGELPI